MSQYLVYVRNGQCSVYSSEDVHPSLFVDYFWSTPQIPKFLMIHTMDFFLCAFLISVSSNLTNFAACSFSTYILIIIQVCSVHAFTSIQCLSLLLFGTDNYKYWRLYQPLLSLEPWLVKKRVLCNFFREDCLYNCAFVFHVRPLIYSCWRGLVIAKVTSSCLPENVFNPQT